MSASPVVPTNLPKEPQAACRALILTGTDFSDGSVAALREARATANRTAALLVLVHVRDPADSSPPVDGQAWASSHGFAIDDYLVRTGQAWAEIAREARTTDATTIVVGSHGQSGVQPLTLGSTATRVALVAPCPVLIVRPRVPSLTRRS